MLFHECGLLVVHFYLHVCSTHVYLSHSFSLGVPALWAELEGTDYALRV